MSISGTNEATQSVPFGTPVATGDATAAGSAATAARSDHVHKGVVANEAWTAYTPTLTNLTLGNGTLVGAYQRLGRVIHYRIKLTWGSTTSATGSTFSLPVAAHADFAGTSIIGHHVAINAGVAHYQGHMFCLTATTAAAYSPAAPAVLVTGTAPFAFGTGDILFASGVYEASS